MPAGVDMTPAGVALRLREMADVSELCRLLVIAGANKTKPFGDG